eukprot:14919445-Alexandrium_andersonii.AAC.1
MSASLVGSEMCIRDSIFLSASRAATVARVHLPSSANADTAGFSAGLAAVSYTHLTLPTICSV